MKSRFLTLYRASSIWSNPSNVGKCFWSWILKDCIKVQEKKLLSCVPVLDKTWLNKAFSRCSRLKNVQNWKSDACAKLLFCWYKQLFTEVEVVSGGKCPPLAADTEVNNCFSIYESSEIIEHKIKMMDFLKTHLLLPTTKFGTQMSFFLADKLHFSRHLFSYYGKISLKGFMNSFCIWNHSVKN